MTTPQSVCPACGSSKMKDFHSAAGVPTNSCLLLTSREEAEAFPTGRMRLGFCQACGFVSNLDFDAGMAEYSGRYEETQAFSPVFVEFAKGLAKHWVDKYDLAGKTVLEVGCGKGEFLTMMVEEGVGSGIGHPVEQVLEHGKFSCGPFWPTGILGSLRRMRPFMADR